MKKDNFMSKALLKSTLALVLCAISLVSFSMDGNGSSGGGDGRYVGDELELRDLLFDPNNMKEIEDNGEFLRSVNNFKELMVDIAKVNPRFSSAVVQELMSLKMYRSLKSLPKLPAADTAVAADEADVQLAIRSDKEIIFAPDFFNFKRANYLLIHEALHGLLKNNRGPFHHHRVNKIVSFIFKNIENLNRNEFLGILIGNNYEEDHPGQTGFLLMSDLWNEQIDLRVRCFIGYNFGRQLVNQFLGHECLGASKDLISFIKEFSASFNEEYARLKLPIDKYEVKGYRMPRVSKVELQDGLIFGRFENKRICKEVREQISNLLELQQKYRATFDFTKRVVQHAEMNNLTHYSELGIIRTMLPIYDEDYGLGWSDYYGQVVLADGSFDPIFLKLSEISAEIEVKLLISSENLSKCQNKGL